MCKIGGMQLVLEDGGGGERPGKLTVRALCTLESQLSHISPSILSSTSTRSAAEAQAARSEGACDWDAGKKWIGQ